jgi:hypothetical protein
VVNVRRSSKTLRDPDEIILPPASRSLIYRNMRKRSRNLPSMMTQLTLSSWETIYRRSLMIAQGTCSAAEYQRMVMEKAAAMQASTLAMMTGRGPSAALAPYLVRSRANAKRLRRS